MQKLRFQKIYIGLRNPHPLSDKTVAAFLCQREGLLFFCVGNAAFFCWQER